MRVGINRMRHSRYRQDFRIFVRHGVDFRLSLRDHVLAKLRRLRIQRHVFQPEQFVGKSGLGRHQ